MISCIPQPVSRWAIQFGPHSLKEILEAVGSSNIDEDRGQSLVNTKRHGWQNVSYGDYLIFDETKRLLKVLKADDFKHNYLITE